MLEAGQVDFVQTAPQDELNRLKENRSLQIYPHPLGRTPILLMKGSNPPFNDVKARQAVAAAIDAEEIMVELHTSSGVAHQVDHVVDMV